MIAATQEAQARQSLKEDDLAAPRIDLDGEVVDLLDEPLSPSQAAPQHEGFTKLPREDPRTVAEAVAAILDAPIPELPALLAEVVRLQSATRRIREANLSAEEQDRLLEHLGPRIKQAAVPELALRAVLAELDDPEAPPLPPPRWEQDQRRLRRENYETCPCCQSPIAIEEELKAYERRRTQARDEAEIRKSALPLVGQR
jgi:hypothetical protein